MCPQPVQLTRLDQNPHQFVGLLAVVLEHIAQGPFDRLDAFAWKARNEELIDEQQFRANRVRLTPRQLSRVAQGIVETAQMVEGGHIRNMNVGRIISPHEGRPNFVQCVARLKGRRHP